MADIIPNNSPTYSPTFSPILPTDDPILNNKLNNLLSTKLTTKIIQDTLTSIMPDIKSKLSCSLISVDGQAKNTIEKYYSSINGSFQVQIPLRIGTTKLGSSGNQQFDVSLFANNTGQSNIILGTSEGETLELYDSTNSSVMYKIKRGTLTDSSGVNQSNQISVNNGEWQNYNFSIKIGDDHYVFSGAGSPIVFKVIYVSNSNSLPKPSKPEKIFDFIFMFAYFFAFISSILYSITTVINIDVTHIFLNKNILLLTNVYFSACGVIGLFTWFNQTVPFNVFNQKVVITQLKL